MSEVVGTPRGRPVDPLERGLFSPLIDPKLVHNRIERGDMAFTPAGREKRCPRCKEMWPADTEFFHSNPKQQDGLSRWCIACSNEYRWENLAERRQAQEARQEAL